jgi:uncharacterized protein YjbI with pentapeptide repeats
MANVEHIAILKQGILAWNRWRQEHRSIASDLSGAYISESTLEWAIRSLGDPLFESADLRGIDLSHANLSHSVLKGANLMGANLQEANLIGANLRRAHLRSANLRNAKLNQVNFTLANLSKSNIEGALIWETVFC